MGWAEYADVCIPQGQFINFSIGQFQIGSSNWTTAVCNENAIARWLYSSSDSSQFSSQRSQFHWKKDGTCHSTNSTPPPNPNLLPMYIVSIDGKDADGVNFQHAITAVLKTPTSNPILWDSYFFMQFDNNNIQINQTESSGPHAGIIQIPVGYGSQVTTVTIKSVTNIIVDDSIPNNPSISYSGSPVETFTIDNQGTPTHQNPV